MGKIKYYIDDVRRNGKEAGEDLKKASPTLFYHYVLTEGDLEEREGWKSYESFTEEEFEYRSAFWDAVKYFYEENDSIEFKIDKERGDSFYHYFEYIDKIFINEGYAHYQTWHTPKEKKAWMKAQKQFMGAMGINTPLFQIRTYISDIKNSFAVEEQKWPKEKSLIMPTIPSQIAEIVKDIADGNMGDDFIDKILSLMSGNIPTMHNALTYTFNAACYNINLKFKKLLEGIKELGVSAFLSPVVSGVLNMTEQYLDEADILYNEVTRSCNKAIRTYRKLVEAGKDDDEGRIKKLTAEFKEQAEKYEEEIKEVLYKILYIDVLLKLMKQLKNMETSTIETWRNVIAEAKTLRDMDMSDIKSTALQALHKALVALLPLLGALIGALYALQCCKEEDRKVDLVGAKRVLDNKKEKDRGDNYTGLENYIIGATEDEYDIDADKLEEDLYKEYIEGLENKIELTLFDVAIVYVKAYYYVDCFSLIGPDGSEFSSSGENSSSDNDSEHFGDVNSADCFPCKMSMCETEDDTDTSVLLTFPVMGASAPPRKVSVEIGQDLFPVSSLCVEVNQHIHIDDLIGYIDGVPIYSKVDCSVQIVEPSYFVAWYFYEDKSEHIDNEEDAEKFVNDYYNEQYETFTEDKLALYQQFIDFYKMSAYTDLFIKDYISFFRFPELALFTRDYSYTTSYHSSVLQDMFKQNFGVSSGYRVANGTEVSSDKFIEKYEDEANDIIDEYNKIVKKKAGKKEVKKMVKANETTKLKTILDEEKKKFTSKILKLYYDNPGGMKYCSKGRIVDFMLCDNWIEYLHNDDFTYDDENPYVIELSEAISDFISIRERLELNKNNINHLISKFNQYCDPVLKKYWFGYTSKYTYMNNYTKNFDYNTTYDYYSRFKEIFKFEYYLDTDSVEEGTKGEDGTIGLFKRVFKYLKALIGIKTNEPAAIELTEDSDISAILDQYDKMDVAPDEEQAKLERKLRQIAHRYISLVRIENGMTQAKITGDGKQYQYVANEYQRLDAAMANDYDGRWTLDIIKQAYFEANEKVLKDYLQNLKTITANELVRLQKIAMKAIDWYNENSQVIYNNEWFEKFREVPWPDPMEIYHECIKTDYYLFTDIFNREYFSPAMGDIDGTGEGEEAYNNNLPIAGEGTIPVKTLDDLDKLEKKIGEDDKKAENDPDLATSVHPKSNADITKMKYWLKYCLMATLVNCMVPIYWATGLVIAGVPTLLPIIYIPFVVIPGRTICVIGLGLCGIIPMPMLLFVNPSGTKSTIILPLNIAIDLIIKALHRLGQVNFNGIEKLAIPLIKKLDGDIQNTEDQLQDIEYQINQIKMTVIDTPKTEYLMKHELDIQQGEDTTTHKKKVEMITTATAQTTLYIPDTYPEYDHTQLPVRQSPPSVYFPAQESAENAGEELYDNDEEGPLTLSSISYRYPDNREKDYSNIIVFLDPGHDFYKTHHLNGKSKSKASPYRMYGELPAFDIEEYKVNRLIAQEVYKILVENCRNLTVLYTIENLSNDSVRGITGRQRYINEVLSRPENKNKHGIMLSMHLNAAGSGNKWYTGKGGWLVYVPEKDARQRLAIPLAECIRARAEEEFGYNMIRHPYDKWKELNIDVLGSWNDGSFTKFANIPTVLTENFFMDFKEDAEYILSHIPLIGKVNAFGLIDYMDNRTTWVLNHEIKIT